MPLKCTQASHKKTRAGRLSPKEGAQARLLAHQVPPLPGTWQSRHEGVTLRWQPLQEAEPLQEDRALRAHQLPSAILPAEPSTPQWLLGKCAQDPRLAHWSHFQHKMSLGGEGTRFSLSLFFVFVFPQWACEIKFHGSRGCLLHNILPAGDTNEGCSKGRCQMNQCFSSTPRKHCRVLSTQILEFLRLRR